MATRKYDVSLFEAKTTGTPAFRFVEGNGHFLSQRRHSEIPNRQINGRGARVLDLYQSENSPFSSANVLLLLP